MSHLLQARRAGGGRGLARAALAGRRSAVRVQVRVGQHLQLLGRGRRRNAVFTVPRAELADGPTAPPAHAEDGAPEILPELVVADWRIADDGAPAELESAFYDYGLHDGLPDEIAHPHDWASEWRTKFGGVPYWTANGAQGVPAGRLLLQIDNWVQLEDGGSTEVANFCSDGTAYIFVDRSREAPVYTMIINR